MTWLKFFMCLILKGFSGFILFIIFFICSFVYCDVTSGILADENATEPHNSVQLWRAQGDFPEEVKDEFYERARFTEDIWKRDEKTIDFLIDEMEIPYVTKLLDKHNITHKVLLKDFVGTDNDTVVKSFPFRRTDISGNSYKWNEYPTLAEINRYVARIAKEFPSHCSLVSIGRTKEKKHINMIKITGGNKRNPVILVEAGMHGNEWTGVVSTLYFIDNIVRTYAKQPAYVKKRDWYVIPLLNPDGYEYSMHSDRTWRKNRRRFSGNIYGVDLNRNFDHDWCVKGTSQVPSNPTYCGPEPFSEEETKAFKRLADGKHFNAYISIHSSGTKVLYPWSGKGGTNKGELNLHRQYTKEMSAAMEKVAQLRYRNGNVQALGMSTGSGMAIDWMFYDKEVTHAYMIETRGNGGKGQLDSKDILSAAKEVTAGLTRFAEINSR